MIFARGRRAQRPWPGFLLGAGLGGICGLAWAGGALDRLDAFGMDLHFRWLSTIRAHPDIVLIDIDDASLAVEDWPWPRRRYAQLVQTLSELGATATVLDLLLAEPSTPRLDHAGLGRHYDVDTAMPVLGDPSEAGFIYDDDELRDAMRQAGNVYLAMFATLAPPAADPDEEWQSAKNIVKDQPGVSLQGLTDALGEPATWDHRRLYALALLAHELETDFGLDETQLAQRLEKRTDLSHSDLRRYLPQAKRIVARQAARRFLGGNPEGGWPAFFARTMPAHPTDSITPDREVLLTAFRAERAYRQITETLPQPDASCSDRLAAAFNVNVPLDKFAEHAAGVGLVAYDRTRSGGVLRRLPLLATSSDGALPQLAFLAAADVLGADWKSIRCTKNQLLFEGPVPLRMPIDRSGTTLVNWHVPGGAEPQDGFVHIPAARMLEIAHNHEAIANNAKRLAITKGELVELRYAETPAEYALYAETVRHRNELRRSLAPTRDSEARKELERQLALLHSEIDGIEQDALLWLRRLWQLWQDQTPRNETERSERERIRHLHEALIEGRLADRLEAADARLKARIDALLTELRPKVAGRICLVGYTASGVADLVTTPVHTALPGVLVHANVINMLLQNRPASVAPTWLQVLIFVAAGLAISWTTASRAAAMSASVLLGLIAAIALFAAWAFWRYNVHLASPVIIAEMLVAWGGVTVLRQLTDERTRRRLQRALGQYTSPAIASRIAERLDSADLLPQPAQVTCFFCDLKGFTPLSERLGPKRTRQVLNPYLGAVSRILVAHGAIVNKFIGDGIFAFFNAPIHPVRDHAAHACRSALAAVEALKTRTDLTAGAGEPLVLRVGLACGEVFVGDYGSDTKLDYTCIGDTVNVAARLETANKTLETTILADERTRRHAGEAFPFRFLGSLAVVGRTRPVASYELLSDNGSGPSSTAAYLQHFAQVVANYQACEWDACLAAIEQCRRLNPDDAALALYERASLRFRAVPPPADWNRALPLTSLA